MWIARKTFSHLPLAKPEICNCVHNPYTSIIFHGNICYLSIMQAVPSLMTVCSCSQNFKVSARSSCTLLKKPVINFTNVFHNVMFFWSYWWLFWSSKRLAEHTWYIDYSWIHCLHRYNIENITPASLFPTAVFELKTEFMLKHIMKLL